MAANKPEPTRILSIQSHVVCGYVGNRSATFPLQLLGWEVDVINTVQFSNHTGFGRWGGARFDEHHLDDLFRGLEENGLLRYARVLTGYIPSPNALLSVKKAIEKLRQLNPSLLYVLDPVMGDIGRGMYVHPDVLPIYKEMLPLSSVITPNQFEAQILADQEITSLSSLREVLLTLHTKHRVPHVLITSVELPEEDLTRVGLKSTLSDGSKGMTLIGSSLESGNASELRPWVIQFPEVQGYFSGVGDLFAALLVGRYKRPKEAQSVTAASGPPSRVDSPALPGTTGQGSAPGAAPIDDLHSAPTPLSRAAELAIASVQAVLATTSEAISSASRVPTRAEWEASLAPQPAGEEEVDEAAKEKRWKAQEMVETFRRRELKIVQSRNGIETPIVTYRASWLKEKA